MSLVEKLKRARESWTTVGKFEFLVRRPTALEGAELARSGPRAQLAAAVVGWKGVTEQDLVPGGTADPVPFDAEVFVEWVSDRPEILLALTTAINDAVAAYAAKRRELEKN